MPNILIIDDDIHISRMLAEVLQGEGHFTKQAASAAEARQILSVWKPDLILLDLMLPDISGEALLPMIKDIPVIVVSAKTDLANKVDLLLGGAADYVTKPFHLAEMLARITVQLRKQTANAKPSVLSYREVTMHTDTHTVYVNDTEIKLTRTEYAILKLLMQKPEQVIARLTILDEISVDTPDCTDDSLKIHIHNLRKKLKSVTGKNYITAVWGIGFMLGEKS